MDRTSTEPLIRHDGQAVTALYRVFYGIPIQSADWVEEYEERVAGWWELFVDLVLVVAWTNVTDWLYESELSTARSILLFVVMVSTVQIAWSGYVQYTTRFVDESLFHSVLLFFMILGLAGMAVHVGQAKFVTEFTVSMLIQKVPLIAMYGGTAYHLKQARCHMGCEALVLSVSAVICVAIVSTQPEDYTVFAVGGWLLIVALEVSCVPIVISKRPAWLVPMNIDHAVDRQNAIVMVTLGESLLSAMIHYGSSPEQVAETTKTRFYGCMSLVLLMAFSIGLLYYNVQPRRHESAFRKSRLRAFCVYITDFALITAILLVGVGVKHSMHATIHSDGQLSAAHAWMLVGNVALVLYLIGCLRLCHYWGFQPAHNDPQEVKNILNLWWLVMVAWPALLLLVAVQLRRRDMDSLGTLGLVAGACSVLAVVETAFTSAVVFYYKNLQERS